MSDTQKKGFTHESHNNLSVDWYTPRWVFDDLALEFDLDPASPKGGVPWIPAKKHYDIEADGLSSPWVGKVWLNPPYGKHTPLWLEKMSTHRNGVALVFARTDCAWFHKYVYTADAILFLKGRIQFVDGLGATKGSGSSSGSMLVAWGDECVVALEAMREKGAFWKLTPSIADLL
jgi:phage N-6-adenine-methyltransferase